MDYKIISSGSQNGNCAKLKFDDIVIMVDIGKAYSRLKKHFDDVDLLLITHKHDDHLNKSAYNQIKINHPSIIIATNQETSDFISEKVLPAPDLIFDGSEPLYVNDIEIYQLPNYHGVECHGFIFKQDNSYHLFATDLSTTVDYQEFLTSHNAQLDTMLLEANYSPDVIQFVEYKKLHTGFDTFNNGSERHLPVEEWELMKARFCKTDARTEQLHISTTYHDFQGCMEKFKDRFTMKDVEEWRTI